jgi:hypothetical protein
MPPDKVILAKNTEFIDFLKLSLLNGNIPPDKVILAKQKHILRIPDMFFGVAELLPKQHPPTSSAAQVLWESWVGS